jgi:hypothetical protein
MVERAQRLRGLAIDPISQPRGLLSLAWYAPGIWTGPSCWPKLIRKKKCSSDRSARQRTEAVCPPARPRAPAIGDRYRAPRAVARLLPSGLGHLHRGALLRTGGRLNSLAICLSGPAQVPGNRAVRSRAPYHRGCLAPGDSAHRSPVVRLLVEDSKQATCWFFFSCASEDLWRIANRQRKVPIQFQLLQGNTINLA